MPSGLSISKTYRAASAPGSNPSYPAAVSVTFSWTSGADNGARVTGYDLRYRQTSPAGSWNTSTGGAVNQVTINFAKGTANYGKDLEFQVQEDNSAGDSAWSASFAFTTAVAPAKPAAPTIAFGHRRIVVSWTAPDGRGASIDGYDVQYRVGASGAWTDHSHTGTGTTATITGLNHAAAYQARIRATNSQGDGAWSDASAELEAGLTAGSVTAAGATLTLSNWTAAWWHKGNQTNAACTSVAANTTTAALTGLTGGTSYVYTAYSASGCNAADEIADAEFATTGLSVNITGVPATTNSVFTATFTFSAAVTGFDISDIKISNATVANFAGSGAVYTADVTPTGTTRRRPGQPRGPSVYSVWVAANAAVDSNNVGNGAAIRRSGTYDASPTLAIEGVPATNNGTAFTARFAFSEAVTGFEASDISLTGATMTGFSGSGAVYSGSVTATADYTISVAAGAAQDATGNATPASSHGGTFDDTAPTVAITGVPAAANGAFTATFTFSEAVTGFATTDTIDATVTGAAVSEIAGVGDGSVYTALITPSADYAVSVAADAAEDAAGNGNTASETASGVYDATAPTVAITGVPDSASGAFTATFTFSESVTGFEAGDIALSNATASDFTGSGAAYTATITPVANGAYSVSVPADAAEDAATNGNTASAAANGTATLAAVTLTASAVEDDTATLTIANHTGDWHYKYTSPTGGTCSTAQSGTTASLTSLSTNTSYTYKAYSDSGCADANELATAAAFLTKPGKPTKPTATAGAGSGRLTLSAAAVTGAGAITKWQYSTDGGTTWADVPGANTATTVGGTVTGLTDGTSYTVQVRAVNATGHGDASDASDGATPADETLAASSVEDDSATLTLTGHTGNWHYKANAAPHASCSSAQSGTTASLASLSTNTSYTYKAYSDSGCADANELAAASAFLTKPGKPSKPTATAGAGSGKLTLSAAAVTGAGAITKWQYSTDSGANWADVPRHQHRDHGQRHGGRPDRRHQLHRPGARGERHRPRRRLRRLGRGDPGGRGAGRERRGRRQRDPHPHRPHRQLALQGQCRAARVLLLGPERDHGQPREPVHEHVLHLQGVQRQRLRRRQ